MGKGRPLGSATDLVLAHRRLSKGLLPLLLAGATACSGPPERPRAVADPTQASVPPAAAPPVEARTVTLSGPEEEDSVRSPLWREVSGWDTSALKLVLGSSAEASDPYDVADRDRPQPAWNGLRLDLGAGQAPYDDAPRSNALLPEGPRGFSDTLMRVVFEGPIARGLTVEAAMAASRFQDEPILSGLEETELAWVSLGIRIRF